MEKNRDRKYIDKSIDKNSEYSERLKKVMFYLIYSKVLFNN